jgi:hypothetical protein
MTVPPQASDELRQEFLKQAGAFFDGMFDPDRQEQLITFDQREEYVVRRGQELEHWLLTRHLAGDEWSGAAKPREACCPHCHTVGNPDTKDREPVPRRLRSRVGCHQLARRKYRCPSCKAVFFPLG